MDEDDEYRRIVRRETAERVDRMVRALRRKEDRPWDEVYRHAHTLAGIADEVDPSMAQVARRVAGLLRDPYGHTHPLSAEEEAKLRHDVEVLARSAKRLSGEDQA